MCEQILMLSVLLYIFVYNHSSQRFFVLVFIHSIYSGRICFPNTLSPYSERNAIFYVYISDYCAVLQPNGKKRAGVRVIQWIESIIQQTNWVSREFKFFKKFFYLYFPFLNHPSPSKSLLNNYDCFRGFAGVFYVLPH